MRDFYDPLVAALYYNFPGLSIDATVLDPQPVESIALNLDQRTRIFRISDSSPVDAARGADGVHQLERAWSFRAFDASQRAASDLLACSVQCVSSDA